MGVKSFAKIMTGLGLLTIVLLFGYTDMITALASPSTYTIKVTASTSNDPYARRHWLNVNNNKMDLGVVAGTASWEGSLSLSPGDAIQYWVDQPCNYATWDSKMYVNGNLVASGPTCEGGGPIVLSYTIPAPQQPDFIVNDISWTPTTIKEGDTVTFNVKFSNIGTGGSTTWFYNNYYIDGQYVDMDGVGTTAGNPSQIHSGDFSWKATSSGWHTVKMVTDGQNQITESNEGNNALEKSFYVEPAQAPQKPDFIINDISWIPSTIKEGDTVTFNVKFSNIGTGGSTTWFYNNYYIDGQYVDMDGVGTTAGDASQIHSGDFSWKATSSGWHTVKMMTDATNLIAEGNEGNNAMEKSFYVNPAQPTMTAGSISVSSTPSGASIYLDGSYKSTTPYTINNVAAGSHAITLKLNNYQDWSTTVNVVAGQTSTISAPLTQAPQQKYALALYVYDSKTFDRLEGAKVYVDNSLKATIDRYGSPDPAIYLLPATYSIRISKDGCTEQSFSVAIPMQGTKYVAMSCNVVASPPSASIQSASVDKSSYNSGETVKISMTIKNSGTIDLSGLKINVDIADPNGNNVKATTLQSGISLSAGQTYSTGYISYYTIPSNPVSGTYKVTVGLWNSDSSKNYDIKYQITSFNVNGDAIGVNQVYYIPSELYNLIVNDDEKLKNSGFYVEGSLKTLKPNPETKNSISIVHQISNDRKTIYLYDKAIGAKKYEQVKVKIKVFDKNDEPVRGIDVYENIKLTDMGFLTKPLSCQIEAITQDDINKLGDYILIQLLFLALPGPDDKGISNLAIPFEVPLLLEDYIERYGTCTEEWAYLKIGSTNNEGFIEMWVRSDLPIPYYKFAVRDDLSCVNINELMDKKIGETEFISITNPKEIEIKAVPKVGLVTGSTGKEWSKNIENFIQKNNLPATHEENSNILLKSTDYDIFIYLITPTDITERRPYDYGRYYHFNPTIDYYQNKGVIKFGDATYDSPSNGLISCYYSDHSLKYMIAGLGEEGFKTALNEFYEGKVNTVVKSPIQEKQDSSKSIIDTISNFFKGIFGW